MISNTRRNFMQGIALAGGTALTARASRAKSHDNANACTKSND